MRNISELIGIIKGISFDGIINDMEVKCLQDWVDKNRNLSYNKDQANMIKLVDAALADHIITDEEREQLLAYSEEYLQNSEDGNSSIYELNGIITGIISDRVVNADEIIKLQQWMKENSFAIRGHKPSEEILSLVEEILADGVITESEQEQLLHLLSARINDTRLKTKINYIKQSVKERKNVGLDLIDILDNEEAINEIHTNAEKQLATALRSYTGLLSKTEDQEIVFVSLCLIAMLKYDGNYYDYVADTYKSIYQKYSRQKIEGTIRSILANYVTDMAYTRYIDIALANAIVPAYFLSDFFDFIFDIYKLNFDYDIPKDLYEEFRFVYEGLSDTMNSDSDDIQINVTKKTYKLIQTTKRLITSTNNIDAIIKLSIIVVKLIDKRFWNKEVKLLNPYLKRGFKEWEKTLVTDKTGIKRDPLGLKSRWTPKYLLDNDHIYLVPPIHRIKSRYEFYKIMVVVKNNYNSFIYLDNRPEIHEIIGGYQVSPRRIKIEEPLGELQYLVKAGDEVVYDSKDYLYRNYIIFDEKGNELKNNSDYKGIVHICAFDNEQRGETYYETKNYKLSVLNVTYGDLLAFGNEIFSFSALSKPGIFGEKREYQFLKEEGTDELLPVFSKVKFLVFEDVNIIKDFLIRINKKNYRLEDFHYTKTMRQASSKYVLDLYNNIKNSGVYVLEIYELRNGIKSKIYNFRFGYDPIFTMREEKIDNTHYLIKVQSGLCDRIIDKEINITNYVDDWLKVKHSGVVYTYYLPLNLEMIRLKNGLWQSISEDLWIEDIGQDAVLQVLGNYANCLVVITETGETVLEKVYGKDYGIYIEIPIGFLTSYKMTNKYVILLFLKDEKRVNATFCINKCFFDIKRTEIKFNPVERTLTILPVYKGKSNVVLEVSDENGTVIYKGSNISPEIPIEIENLHSFVDYKVSFYEKPKGLTLKGRKELLSIRKAFYAWKDLVGYYVRIKEVHYDQKIGNTIQHKKHSFDQVYIYFEKRISDDIFGGRILIRKGDAMLILKELDKILIEICSDIINGEIDLDITRFGRKLLLDINKHHILKTTFNNKAAEILSYTIEMKGVARL